MRHAWVLAALFAAHAVDGSDRDSEVSATGVVTLPGFSTTYKVLQAGRGEKMVGNLSTVTAHATCRAFSSAKPSDIDEWSHTVRGDHEQRRPPNPKKQRCAHLIRTA